MKSLTVKRMERSEKKKKKLAALANLVHLNDQDRLEQKSKDMLIVDEEQSSMTTAKFSANHGDDGFVMVISEGSFKAH